MGVGRIMMKNSLVGIGLYTLWSVRQSISSMYIHPCMFLGYTFRWMRKSFWQVWRNGGYRGRMCRKSTREVRISLTGIWHAEIKILMVLGVATNFLSPSGGAGGGRSWILHTT